MLSILKCIKQPQAAATACHALQLLGRAQQQLLVSNRCLQSQARLPVERLQQVITPDVCTELAARGYAVVDGVFGASMAHQLELELMNLWRAGRMHLNHTHLVSQGNTQLLAKSAVMEAELTFDPAIRAAAPLVAQLDADRGMATMLSLLVPQLRLESHAIKMQYNEGGGGCFPMHFDSDDQLDGRRVTAIFYLNSQWQPSHGGQLRLYPFPAPPVDIAPINDRLVMFSSTRMLHRVLPSKAPRSCFTIWLSEGRPRGAAATGSPPLPPPGGAAAGAASDALWQFLMQAAVRQHVCKLAYADEWEQSIRESHPPCAETDAALSVHRQEVAAIKKALGKFEPGLQQLLAAAATVADSAARANAGAGDVGGQNELGDAISLLQQVAAHVKWF